MLNCVLQTLLACSEVRNRQAKGGKELGIRRERGGWGRKGKERRKGRVGEGEMN